MRSFRVAWPLLVAICSGAAFALSTVGGRQAAACGEVPAPPAEIEAIEGCVAPGTAPAPVSEEYTDQGADIYSADTPTDRPAYRYEYPEDSSLSYDSSAGYDQGPTGEAEESISANSGSALPNASDRAEGNFAYPEEYFYKYGYHYRNYVDPENVGGFDPALSGPATGAASMETAAGQQQEDTIGQLGNNANFGHERDWENEAYDFGDGTVADLSEVTRSVVSDSGAWDQESPVTDQYHYQMESRYGEGYRYETADRQYGDEYDYGDAMSSEPANTEASTGAEPGDPASQCPPESTAPANDWMEYQEDAADSGVTEDGEGGAMEDDAAESESEEMEDQAEGRQEAPSEDRMEEEPASSNPAQPSADPSRDAAFGSDPQHGYEAEYGFDGFRYGMEGGYRYPSEYSDFEQPSGHAGYADSFESEASTEAPFADSRPAIEDSSGACWEESYRAQADGYSPPIAEDSTISENSAAAAGEAGAGQQDPMAETPESYYYTKEGYRPDSHPEDSSQYSEERSWEESNSEYSDFGQQSSQPQQAAEMTSEAPANADESPAVDHESEYEFDARREGEPGEMIDYSQWREPSAYGTAEPYEEYAAERAAMEQSRSQTEPEEGYCEWPQGEQIASEIRASEGVAESGLELFAWRPADLLAPPDQQLLRTLETLCEEPSGSRRSVLNDHLEAMGPAAIDFASRFEDVTGLEVLGLVDDQPSVAAFLGCFRLMEQGELGMDEAVDLLRRSLQRPTSEWVEGVREITAGAFDEWNGLPASLDTPTPQQRGAASSQRPLSEAMAAWVLTTWEQLRGAVGEVASRACRYDWEGWLAGLRDQLLAAGQQAQSETF